MKSRVSCISGRHADCALGDDAGVYREERSAAHLLLTDFDDSHGPFANAAITGLLKFVFTGQGNTGPATMFNGRAGERQLDEALQPLGPTNIVETVTLGRDTDH